ncbi:hypothetical protein ACSSV9_14475 [Melioribacter sp. OK-6-Me]|uniref:hypothetical protein n=1 Tax=Melioribacter sp. OK-6-Me TaxID=3423433 RepID=UPI003ED9ADF7
MRSNIIIEKEKDRIRNIIIDKNSYEVEDYERYDGKNYHTVIPMHEIEKLNKEELPSNFIFYLHDTNEYINIRYSPDISIEYELSKENENVCISFFGTITNDYNPDDDLIMNKLSEVVKLRAKKTSDVRIEEIRKSLGEYSITFLTTISFSTFQELNQKVSDLIKILILNAVMPIMPDDFSLNIFHTEEEFSKNMIIPLFRRLGFQDVKYKHGKDEYGIDILLSKLNELNAQEYWGIQVKKGKISGSANSIIDKIISQIDDAFNIPFETTDSPNPVYISKLVIITDNHFSNNATKKINSKIKIPSNRNNTLFIDYDKLCNLLQK